MDEMPSKQVIPGGTNIVTSKSILLVDDEAVITTQLEERLTRMGYSVVGRAASAEEGIEMARRLRPDLILMDIVMPGEMDGIDATEIIGREMAIPVIFLTAYGDDRYIERAKKVNPEGYIIKPYQENEIKAVIEIVMERRRSSPRAARVEDMFGIAISHMPHALFVLDATGKPLTWNAPAARMFGYDSSGPMPGCLDELLVFGGRSTPGDLLYKALSVREEESGFVEIEMEGMRKDGRRFPVQLSAAPVGHRGGEMIACLAHDISRCKNAEKRMGESIREMELVIREIHHRVKNNFQIIVSLLGLQSRRVADPAIRGHLSDCQGRVRAMALVHENLHLSGDFNRVDVSVYLKAMMRDIHRAFSHESRAIALRESLEPVELCIDQAVPCGIIVNELLTNAFKYAFPSSRQDEAFIEVVVRRGGEGQVEIVVSDNGIGLPEGLDPENAATLGFSLVHMLVHQLKGTVSIGRKNGTRISFSFDARR